MCFKKRTTLDHERMVYGVCTVCSHEMVAVDQNSLFANEENNGQQTQRSAGGEETGENEDGGVRK